MTASNPTMNDPTLDVTLARDGDEPRPTVDILALAQALARTYARRRRPDRRGAPHKV